MERDQSLESHYGITGGNLGTHSEKILYKDWDVDRIISFGAQNFVTGGVNSLDLGTHLDSDGQSIQSATMIVDYPISKDENAGGLISYYQLKTDDENFPKEDADAFSLLKSIDSSISANLFSGEDTRSFLQMTYSNRDRRSENSIDAMDSSFYHVLSSSKQYHLRNINSIATSNIKMGIDLMGEEYQIQSSDSIFGYSEILQKRNQLGLFILREDQFLHETLYLSYGLRGEWLSNEEKVGVYQLMLQYMPSQELFSSLRMSPYLMISSGFRAPTLYELYSTYGNIQLQAERSESGEFGIQALHKNDLQIQAAYFQNHFRDMISFANSKYQNTKRSVTSGVEASLQTGEWKVSMAQLHCQDEDTGQKLLRRPSMKLNIGNTMKFSQHEVQTQVEYQDEREDLDKSGARINLKSFWKTDLKYIYHFSGHYNVANDFLSNVLKKNAQLWVHVLNFFNNDIIESANYVSVPPVVLFGFKADI